MLSPDRVFWADPQETSDISAVRERKNNESDRTVERSLTRPTAVVGEMLGGGGEEVWTAISRCLGSGNAHVNPAWGARIT